MSTLTRNMDTFENKKFEILRYKKFEDYVLLKRTFVKNHVLFFNIATHPVLCHCVTDTVAALP